MSRFSRARRSNPLPAAGAPACAIGAVFTLVALLGSVPQDAGAQARRADADPQYTDAGPAGCQRCHGGRRMHAIAGTAHGNTDNPFTPWSNHGCESCHGPGSLHVSRARGGIGFPAMISFRDAAIETQTGACLSCHAQDMGDLEGFEWAGSVHDNGIVSCVSCHEVHTPNDLSERPAQVETCSMCHSSQISNHRRFEDVGIVFDELNCYNCHAVHEMLRDR